MVEIVEGWIVLRVHDVKDGSASTFASEIGKLSNFHDAAEGAAPCPEAPS